MGKISFISLRAEKKRWDIIARGLHSPDRAKKKPRISIDRAKECKTQSKTIISHVQWQKKRWKWLLNYFAVETETNYWWLCSVTSMKIRKNMQHTHTSTVSEHRATVYSESQTVVVWEEHKREHQKLSPPAPSSLRHKSVIRPKDKTLDKSPLFQWVPRATVPPSLL